MTGNEFIKRIQRLAKQRDIESRIDLKRGKGSHVTLYLGDKFTIVVTVQGAMETASLRPPMPLPGMPCYGVEMAVCQRSAVSIDPKW